jgi:hypothetical protein
VSPSVKGRKSRRAVCSVGVVKDMFIVLPH